MKKAKYIMTVPPKKTPRLTAAVLAAILIACTLTLKAATYLPYAGFIQVALLMLCAAFVNHTLKQGTFSIKYILYDDFLLTVMHCGLIERTTHTFILSDAAICENKIVYNGKEYSFYPDEKLKSLLNL